MKTLDIYFNKGEPLTITYDGTPVMVLSPAQDNIRNYISVEMLHTSPKNKRGYEFAEDKNHYPMPLDKKFYVCVPPKEPDPLTVPWEYYPNMGLGGWDIFSPNSVPVFHVAGLATEELVRHIVKEHNDRFTAESS